MPQVLVCMVGEIADGGTRLVTIEGIEIGVMFHRGSYYAYRNQCPHQGGPACEGLRIPRVVERIGDQGVHLGQEFDEGDMHIVCPWHGWEFHLENGINVIDPRFRLKKFNVVQKDDKIYVAV